MYKSKETSLHFYLCKQVINIPYVIQVCGADYQAFLSLISTRQDINTKINVTFDDGNKTLTILTVESFTVVITFHGRGLTRPFIFNYLRLDMQLPRWISLSVYCFHLKDLASH